ncbi:glycosyltransferase family 2 protein [uncultured Treponema sp.]|uniref:glycosyltransferase family 2 protein n=1 Tax=uncultured Treponema sp. TaxID=162155 RepID=UPI002590A674|nr:glycosyltransferase family 2 protein [uncultured Treponema sp.]
MDVSIIIVNYKTKQLTLDCLASVYEQTQGLQFEVFVSDNGSLDGSVEAIREKFPQVRLIENNANLGFGAANNRALAQATGKYVFYLNSDTLLLNNAVKYFFDYWESVKNKNEIGALGCVLLDSEKNPTHSGDELPTYDKICAVQKQFLKGHIKWSMCKLLHLQNLALRLWNRVKQAPKQQLTAGKIGYVTGADLFLMNNDYARFDENFFLYYEETDLQNRLVKAGKTNYLIDGPSIIHKEKRREKNFSITTFSVVQAQRSALYYAKKNLQTKIGRLKFLTLLDWLNPFEYKLTKPFLKELKSF